MIRLREKPAVPESLKTSRVRTIRTRLVSKVRSGQRPSTNDGDFPSDPWLSDDVRLALWRHHKQKCCYCERYRDPKREPDIEHFRPKAEVSEEGPRSLGYWWLAYRWSNLFFSCRTCNQEYKKNHFPLLGGSRAVSPKDRLSEELPALIDPCSDDPESALKYIWETGKHPMAKPIGFDSQGRGQATIESIGLDRSTLNDQRGRAMLLLEAIAQKAITALGTPTVTENYKNDALRAILTATEADQEFAGFRRAYFRALGLGEYVADDRL